MKNHFKLLFTGKNRMITWFLILLGALAISIVLAIGTGDIGLPGMFTMYAGATLLVAAFFHIWKKWRYFLVLFLISLVAVPFFILLHNVFYGLSELYPEVWFTGIFKSLEGFTFVLAVMVFPPAVIVGLVGAVIAFIRERKSGEQHSD
jgi:hypothetical protein